MSAAPDRYYSTLTPDADPARIAAARDVVMGALLDFARRHEESSNAEMIHALIDALGDLLFLVELLDQRNQIGIEPGAMRGRVMMAAAERLIGRASARQMLDADRLDVAAAAEQRRQMERRTDP